MPRIAWRCESFNHGQCRIDPSANITALPQPSGLNLTFGLGCIPLLVRKRGLCQLYIGVHRNSDYRSRSRGDGFTSWRNNFARLRSRNGTARCWEGDYRTSINNFTPISNSSTTATYTSQNILPTLVTTASNGTSNGQVRQATTGPHGMLISGTVLYLPANHNVTFTPNDGVSASTLKNSYDCGRKTWLRDAEIQEISIEDQANVLGSDLGRVPVIISNSSRVLTNPLLN